jgi:hypothetical protein
MSSRWLLPAAAFLITLCLTCIADWPEHVPVAPVHVLAAVCANATLAFGLALICELAQRFRARFVRFDRAWSLGLFVIAVTFSWCVGSELVRAVQRLAAIGFVHVLASTLAAGCVLALFGLRSSGFGLGGPRGQKLAMLSNIALLALLFSVQQRYSVQLREAKFAAVSAAFLVLTGLSFLRVVERLRPVESNRRGLIALICAFSLSATGFALSPEQSLRQLYFAGLFPGRVLFALHLPELLVHRAARRASIARALESAALPAQRSEKTPRVPRDDSRADVVVFLLVDALRADVFHRYLREPNSKLHRAFSESCVASTLYAPSSSTSGTLTKLLWQSSSAEELWFDQARQAGVKLSLVVDQELAVVLNRSLPHTVDSQFDHVVRVPRHGDGQIASLSAAVKPLLGAPGPQLIWAHFFDVHEWDHEDPQAGPERYYDRVDHVSAQIADLIDVISQSERKVSVVVTSDHGEGIDHFSTRHHGDYVYEPLVRVPVLLWTHGYACPENAAALSASAPSAMLLRRLTLDELGIASAAQALSLEELAAQPVVIRATMQDAIIRWPHKLIVSPWFTQLFDLESDPNELHDLSKRSRALVSDLRDQLEAETLVF